MMDTLKQLLLCILTISALTACSTGGIPPATITPSPEVTETEIPKNLNLATPYAQLPAAGICTSFNGEMVTVSINPELPDPRCAKVRADQKLVVINQTDSTIEITIGKFSTSIEPGAQTIIESPFGDYLAPGVHQLQVIPCCGAELWLEGQ